MTTPCGTVLVEIIGKLDFVPVINPTDYLLIQHIPALKEMVMTLNNAENEPDALKRQVMIANGTKAACALLDKELSHYLGDGHRRGINVIGSGMPDAMPVDNLL